jgi:hypothetical protein
MAAPSSIEQLKALVSAKKGVARTNLYSVILPSIGNTESPRNLMLLCSSITLPSRQLATTQREMGADLQNVVYGFNNPNVTMTFRVLNDHGARQYFEAWQDQILPRGQQEGVYASAYPDTYVRPIQIAQLRKGWSIPVLNYSKDIKLGPININLDFDLDAGTEGSKAYEWTLDRAYPVSVAYETLSDESQNEISSFTVEFSYRSWKGQYFAENDTKVGFIAEGGITTDIGSQITNKLYNI